MHHHVGNIAVYKNFSRCQADDFVGWYAAVGAANPHVLGLLLIGKASEETRAALLHLGGPGPVAFKEVVKFVWHRALLFLKAASDIPIQQGVTRAFL
jgi:hypothetical protein